jgi:hypothetical protein
MQDSMIDDNVKTVGEMLVEGFGRMNVRTGAGFRGHVVSVPGGPRVFVRHASEEMVLVGFCVSEPDWSAPGLADFLLRENAIRLIGRFQRTGDTLIMEHAVPIDWLDATELYRVILTLVNNADNAAPMLEHYGALSGGD